MTSDNSLSLVLRRLDEIERKLDRIVEELRMPPPSAIRCAEAISQGRTEERNYPQGTPLRGLGLAAMNKFLAQMDKSQTGLVQKMHSVSN